MSRLYPPSQIVRPKTWEDIEQHYISLNQNGFAHDRFLELVRHIRSGEVSKRLFACTSLDKLLMSIYNPIEFGRETLSIEFNRHNQQWLFKYHPKPFEKVEFERVYPAEKGIEKFDAFIELVKW